MYDRHQMKTALSKLLVRRALLLRLLRRWRHRRRPKRNQKLHQEKCIYVKEAESEKKKTQKKYELIRIPPHRHKTSVRSTHGLECISILFTFVWKAEKKNEIVWKKEEKKSTTTH